jgi:hypothetical protein
MNILFPTIKLRYLPPMLGITLLGGIVAGLYGILHDQITYSISEEYFTKLKFHQFHYANFGWPVRLFVAEVGFLATWWVGAFSAWFLARIAVPAWPFPIALRRCLTGFLIIFSFAVLAASLGFALGLHHTQDYSYWQEMCMALGVTDIPAFVRVAYIHNASYLGGLLGLLAAIAYLMRLRSLTGTPVKFHIMKSKAN